MLIEFRVGNFRSFNEPQTLSLVASADSRLADNCIPFEKLGLLKCAAVYGANASGKSNLIKAFRFMRAFVVHSATQMNIGDLIGVEPFRLDPDSQDKASFFEAQFIVKTIRYQYGFTVTSKQVEDEWLIAYPRGRPQHLLQRRFDRHTRETAWKFRGELHKEGKLIRERTRDNGLALSRGAELNIELDCSMHPALTRKLVELFQTRDANTQGAQLVFSTHDSVLMDLELFRRDQIWIVEKDRAQASHLCSLYDFQEKPRNNEAVQRRYLAGHYGGVPVFGPTFEDLELE